METDRLDALSRHATQQEGFGLAVLDLDNVKRVNDACGHEAGDRVLTEFAQLVQSGIRLRDRLYRLGGEEFVLLLPGADEQRLRSALEHLLQRLRRDLSAPNGPVTVSIRAACLRADEGWIEWLARADAALYAAKRGGRDRLVMADATATFASAEASTERRHALEPPAP